MLTAHIVEPEFYGHAGLAGSAAVEMMQRSLLSLSQTGNWPAVNPGPVTGTVTDQTITALAQALGKLSGLDAGIKAALDAAISLATSEYNPYRDQAMGVLRQQIEQYATYITAALVATIAKYGPKGSGSTPTSPPPPGGRFTIRKPSGTVMPRGLPAGAITARTPAGTWRVAVPKAAGLGGRTLGAAYQEIAPVATQPPGAVVVQLPEFEAKVGVPFYKNWKIMVPVGVGAAALAGAAVWWWRR